VTSLQKVHFISFAHEVNIKSHAGVLYNVVKSIVRNTRLHIHSETILWHIITLWIFLMKQTTYQIAN